MTEAISRDGSQLFLVFRQRFFAPTHPSQGCAITRAPAGTGDIGFRGNSRLFPLADYSETMTLFRGLFDTDTDGPTIPLAELRTGPRIVPPMRRPVALSLDSQRSSSALAPIHVEQVENLRRKEEKSR